MEDRLMTKIKRGWNAFKNRDPTVIYRDYGPSYSSRPDRLRLTRGNEKTIVTALFNRVAIDISQLDFRHCQLDKENRFEDELDTELNKRFTVEANIDQTPRELLVDIVMSMFDEGVVAVVPVETDVDPDVTDSYKILSLRTAKILEWYPKHVKVRLYNDENGRYGDLVLPKSLVAIITNPLYSVINERNSTVQRLIRKLSLLDITDEQTASGKLDLIIQLPYLIKTEARKNQAESRRKDIEMQLSSSKYGIAYADGTEKITQLNRPVENNLMKQVEYLTNIAYSQIGFSQNILDGTASEQEMLNYNSKLIEPIANAIVDEFRRKFLTKTARSQKKSIMFFRDPFKLVPVNAIADIADKFTRNEIMTSNEIRQKIGVRPSKDPKADMLINSNLNHPDEDGEENKNLLEGEDEQNGKL